MNRRIVSAGLVLSLFECTFIKEWIASLLGVTEFLPRHGVLRYLLNLL